MKLFKEFLELIKFKTMKLCKEFLELIKFNMVTWLGIITLSELFVTGEINKSIALFILYGTYKFFIAK